MYSDCTCIHIHTYTYIGAVFKEQGRSDQAIAHFLEAIRIDPLYAPTYINLGNICYNI